MLKTLGVRSAWWRVLAVSLVIASACQRDPFVHEYSTARPAESELVGTYRPDRETTQRMKDELGVAISTVCQLTVRSDGSFTIREMPRCWFVASPPDCVAGTENIAGTWEVIPQGEWWAVGFAKRSTVNGVDHSYRFPAMLRGGAPPYVLHFIIGDPDAGNGLAFTRDPRPNYTLKLSRPGFGPGLKPLVQR